MRIAFSIACSSDGSQGWIVISVGSGMRQVADLVERRGRAVVVHADAVEHGEGGAAGAHGGQLAPDRLDGGVHALLGVGDRGP